MPDGWAERWNLRLRFFLFFALILLGTSASIAGAMIYLAAAAPQVPVNALVLGGGVALFASAGLTLWVWLKFDDHVAQPLMKLGAELRASVHAGTPREIPQDTGRYLGLLAPAVREAAVALLEARADVEEMVAVATAEADRQKGQLEAVLRDLQQGVVICTLDHKVLLYNRFAHHLLDQGRSGPLGLERRLTGLVAGQPLRHSLERLTRRFSSGRYRSHKDGLAAQFIGTTACGHESLRGRMSLILGEEEREAIGYVVTFDKVTDELAAGIWRDRLLQDVTRDMRQRVATLSLSGEVLLRKAPMDDAARERLRQTVDVETRALGERLDRLDQVAGDLLAGAWPMTEVYSSTLMDCIAARRSEGRDLSVAVMGDPLWLSCDSATVVDLVDRMMNRIGVWAQVRDFRLSTSRREGTAYLDLLWAGEPVPEPVLEGWLDEPLEEALGAMTGRDVLSRHKTDVWSDVLGGGQARLRLPLAVAVEHQDRPMKSTAPLAPRPEFYDFDLFARPTPSTIGETLLRNLSYVVFDTETTGLEPSRGDDLVSVAGVRIVNDRVLRGEIFDGLVNPGRPIPPASSRIHGITDDMVAEADPVEQVLPRFYAFIGDSVLVAHNAAFDMTFLSKYQGRTGLRFEQPVLDTVLLAGHIFGASESLTLDALAERFGIVIPVEDRHTALGDALATAEVLRKLIALLTPLGVVTLSDAIKVSNRQVALRRRQRRY